MAHLRWGQFMTAGAAIALAGVALAQVPMTPLDFKVPGTQFGDMPASNLWPANNCRSCHGYFNEAAEPYATWAGSLMALGGKDPLFFAQMTNANQDVANVGTFCLRCHVPVAVVSGHADDASGNSLDARDREGVTCHFCHSMVDPQYQSGVSPPEDAAILAALADVPQFTANAMFVLDPQGRRRGPRSDHQADHELLVSPFLRDSRLCGTCHDVGNVAVSKLPDGRYRYNAINAEAPDHDPWTQFPLERTFTEWQLSAFADGGVDLGGRFGGRRGNVVSSCQDCHMPTTASQACSYGPVRQDMATHDFAGAAVPSLDLIAAYTANDPAVDPAHIAAGRAKALSMLRRAATIELSLTAGTVLARVLNQTGHKLPTGHIEGRRAWLNLRFFDASGALVLERGHYDTAEAHLDEAGTTVYEMLVALSDDAAAATGKPAGVTTHMALADTIWKDTRIPPRGFDNAAFADGGAPAVGIGYADGQYWHDTSVTLPAGAVRVDATLYYQSLTRHYIEALRDGNATDHWGQTLHNLWQATGRGAPIAMASERLTWGDMIFSDGLEGTAP